MVDVDPLALGSMVAYCGWNPLEVVTAETIVLNGKGTGHLELPSLHVTDVLAVVVTDPLSGEDVALTVGPRPADVSWSEDGTLTRSPAYGFPQVFPQDSRNVKVTYSGGYAEPPAELAAALASIARRSGSSGNVKEKQIGKARFVYFPPGELLLTERMVLDRYRIIRTA